MEKINNIKEKKGITLIALVITIIVLLILAGVSISMLTGENGIIKKAQIAKEETKISQAIEDVELKIMEVQVENMGEADLTDLLKVLEKAQEKYDIIIKGTKTAQINTLKDESEGTVTFNEETKTLEPAFTEINGLIITNPSYGVEVEVDSNLKITNEPQLATGNTGGSGNAGTGAGNGGESQSSKPSVPVGKQIGTADKLFSGYCLYDENDNLIQGTYEPPSSSGSTIIKEPSTTHSEVHDLDSEDYKCEWSTLNEIAKIISSNESDEENPSIVKNTTAEVTVNVGGKDYTIGVGDYKNVKYNGADKKVRILGFNHDELASSNAYGTGTNCRYAGISWEFMDLLYSEGMNSASINTNGWAGSRMKSNLNNTSGTKGYAGIDNNLKTQIKQVKKEYIKTSSDANSVTISNDYLWLLSCSEIWGTGYQAGAYGNAITKEGNQYKYYKDINATYYVGNGSLKKPNASSASDWWLRSPLYSDDNSFCHVSSGGGCLDHRCW